MQKSRNIEGFRSRSIDVLMGQLLEKDCSVGLHASVPFPWKFFIKTRGLGNPFVK